MARGGRGDIPGKDSVLVVVMYIYICHIYIIYISVTSRVLVHDATSLRNFDMTPTDSTKNGGHHPIPRQKLLEKSDLLAYIYIR